MQEADRVDTARSGHRRVSFRSTVRGLPKDHAVAALHVCATPISERVGTPLCWTQLELVGRDLIGTPGRCGGLAASARRLANPDGSAGHRLDRVIQRVITLLSTPGPISDCYRPLGQGISVI